MYCNKLLSSRKRKLMNSFILPPCPIHIFFPFECTVPGQGWLREPMLHEINFLSRVHRQDATWLCSPYLRFVCDCLLLSLFVCSASSCELEVLWTASRDLHLCSPGGEEGSPLYHTVLSQRSCNSLGEPLQPPCMLSALQLVPRSHSSLENSSDTPVSPENKADTPVSPENKDLRRSSSGKRYQDPCWSQQANSSCRRNVLSES